MKKALVSGICSVALLALALLVTTSPASAAKAPVGKTYFIASLGVATDESEAYELDVGCVRFSRSEICEMGGDCGRWWRIEEQKRRGQSAIGFEFEMIDDETGLPVIVRGIGRIDGRGPRNSIAAAAHGFEPTSGVTLNFAFAARAVGAARCEQLVADFEGSQ